MVVLVPVAVEERAGVERERVVRYVRPELEVALERVVRADDDAIVQPRNWRVLGRDAAREAIHVLPELRHPVRFRRAGIEAAPPATAFRRRRRAELRRVR